MLPRSAADSPLRHWRCRAYLRGKKPSTDRSRQGHADLPCLENMAISQAVSAGDDSFVVKLPYDFVTVCNMVIEYAACLVAASVSCPKTNISSFDDQKSEKRRYAQRKHHRTRSIQSGLSAASSSVCCRICWWLMRASIPVFHQWKIMNCGLPKSSTHFGLFHLVRSRPLFAMKHSKKKWRTMKLTTKQSLWRLSFCCGI